MNCHAIAGKSFLLLLVLLKKRLYHLVFKTINLTFKHTKQEDLEFNFEITSNDLIQIRLTASAF